MANRSAKTMAGQAQTMRPRRPRPGGEAKPPSLVAQAYEALKERIITLHFLPGQYLSEGDLSALLGLGRTPVHQALQRLHLEGLVEVMPRKGIIVMPDSIAEILKILDSRLTVEPELARLAARAAPPAVVKDLKAKAVATKAASDVQSTIDAFTVNDRAFHQMIGALSGNEVMSDFARNLHERSTRFWYLHLWQTLDVARSNREHAAIALAIGQGDGDAAALAMHHHLMMLRGSLGKVQAGSGGLKPPLLRPPRPT